MVVAVIYQLYSCDHASVKYGKAGGSGPWGLCILRNEPQSRFTMKPARQPSVDPLNLKVAPFHIEAMDWSIPRIDLMI